MKNNAVLIPIYKTLIDSELKRSINRIVEKIDTNKWDIIFIAPHSFDYSEYKTIWKSVKVMLIDFWEGTLESYNTMLMKVDFYNKFLTYEYLLIIQDDVYLLRDIDYVDSFIEEGWGYVGAPWFYKTKEHEKEMTGYKRYIFGRSTLKIINWLCVPRLLRVGNGGLSLRNTKKIIQVLKKNRKNVKNWLLNEDGYFAYFGQFEKGFLPAVERAKEFSLEIDAKEIIKNEGIVPFGVHKWVEYYPDIKEEFG